MIDVSVLIVSWNTRDLLAACLESLYAHVGDLVIEIIVVDSASSDGTVEMIQRHFPQVRLYAQTENIGFTRGNNLALGEAAGRYLLLLNPDTRVLPGALSAMKAYLDAHTDVGIVGPHTLNPDGTTQSTKRRFPTLLTGIFESTWLQGFAPRAVMERYYAADLHNDTASDVDWVQGSAMMARRELAEQIGGLDEGFVMYSEELDWCKRAKLAGWRVVYLPTAQIIHYGGKSAEQAGERTHIHFQQSKLRYFRKYHGQAAAQFLRVVLLLNYFVQLCIEGIKGLLGHKRAMRQERVRAYWQVLRSGLKVT